MRFRPLLPCPSHRWGYRAPSASAPVQADQERLRRNRDRSLRAFAVGIVLMLVFGLGYGFSHWLAIGAGGDLLYILSGDVAIWLAAAVLLYCAGSALAWMYWGARLRRAHDPWAYDPELDGPDPRVRRGLEQHGPKRPRPPAPP